MRLNRRLPDLFVVSGTYLSHSGKASEAGRVFVLADLTGKPFDVEPPL
jgi:hypothetical protein